MGSIQKFSGTPIRAASACRQILTGIRRKLDLWVLATLVVLAAAIAALNIGGWYVLHFIDILWPLNPAGNLSALQFSWSPVNLGTFTFVNAFNFPLAVWLFGLGAVGVPVPIQELLTLTLLQAVGGYSFYALVRRFVLPSVSPNARALALLASVAYLLNYYTLTVGWWDNVPGFFWLMGFGPLFLYFALDLHSSIQNQLRLNPVRISALAVSSFLAFSTNVPFNVSLLALVVVLPILVFTTRNCRSHSLFRGALVGYFLIGVIVLATSLWWIGPDYLQSVYAPTYVGGGSATSYNLALFTSSSSALTLLTALTGLYGVEYPFYAHTAVANSLYTEVAGPTSMLIGAAILVATVLAPTAQVRRRQGALLACVVVIALFLLGVNSPIAPGLEYLLESSSIALQALRNPFLSFGFAMCVVLILSLAHSVEVILAWISRGREPTPDVPRSTLVFESARWRLFRLSRQASNRTRMGIALFVSIILFVPLIAAGSPILVGNAVPSAPFQARMAIPAYEYDVANYLDSRLNDSYALLFPGGFLEQNWSHGYDGYDVLPSLLPGAFLIYDSGTGFVASPNPMLSDAYASIQAGTTHLIDFATLLGRLGVSTVVIEGDVGGSSPFGFNPPPDYPLILGSLNRTTGLGSPRVIGPDTIYTTNNSYSIASSATQAIDASSLTNGIIVPQVNLTSLYTNASSIETTLAPEPLFPLTSSVSGAGVSVGPEAKAALQFRPLGGPLAQFGQPIVFNGAPIPISTAAYDSISITFSTNVNTALTISVVDESNLSELSPAALSRHLFVLGGTASSLGFGTASLFPAYGADHFWTNGSVVTLTDDLRQTMYPNSESDVYYLLFSMFPVVDGRGTPGIPVANWTGTQAFTIESITLGNPFYAPASTSPSPVSVFVPGSPTSENLTAAYLLSAINQTSSTAPAHNFLPTASGGVLNATLNQSVKAMIASSPLALPFGQGYPPSVFNDDPIPITLSGYSYLNVAFSTNDSTAVTVALLDQENLSSLSASSLQNATIVLGGSGNSLGYGDSNLFSAFGADHFISPDTITEMSQALTELDTPSIPPEAYYLVFSFFPVASNGSGIRFVPVQDWPGVQNLDIYSIALSNYLIDGKMIAEPPDYFGPAPTVPWREADPFNSSTAVVNGTLPQLRPTSSVSITAVSFVSYSIRIQSLVPSRGPFLIVFRQNFADGWMISGPNLANATHVLVDSGLNGFVLYLRQNATSATVTVAFAGQPSYALSLDAGFSLACLAVVSPLAIGASSGLHRRRRESRR